MTEPIGTFRGIDIEQTNIPGLYNLYCRGCGEVRHDLTTGQTRGYLGSHSATCLKLLTNPAYAAGIIKAASDDSTGADS